MLSSYLAAITTQNISKYQFFMSQYLLHQDTTMNAGFPGHSYPTKKVHSKSLKPSWYPHIKSAVNQPPILEIIQNEK